MGRHIVALLVVAVGVPALAAPPKKSVVVERTLETAIGLPMVYVQLRQGNRVLTGLATELERLMGHDNVTRSFPAFLDTGASAFVISSSTARRFGIEATSDAVYHEVGLHGDVPMGVSRVYRLGLADYIDPALGPGEFTIVRRDTRLQLSSSAEIPVWQQIAAGIDVIGMPAIEMLVIEIEPTPVENRRRPRGGRADDPLQALDELQELLRPPIVRLHGPQRRPRNVDLVIALEYMDFNRRHLPANSGPLPELAPNPMITDITVEDGGRTATGDWLLDTGAAASIISSALATKIGLLDAAGQPTRPPDFSLVMGGIRGSLIEDAGFIVDRLRVPADRGRTLEFRNVRVLVRDIGIQLGPDRVVVLDGVFGMNLLLPSATGLVDGAPDEVADSAFKRIWIDGRRRTLSLQQ